MKDIDTILWREESDNFTGRAQSLLRENLYNSQENQKDIKNIIRILPAGKSKIKKILDIGCAYGSFTGMLAEKFPEAKVIGIDPGKKSIALARKHFENEENLFFYNGYSHEIKFNEQFDLIILRMVLQWIPRKYLLKTVAEVDRLAGNFIYIKEFFPKIPATSISVHNKKVRIYKQNYPAIFTSLPFYKIIYKKIINARYGDDFKKGEFLLKKFAIKDSYLNKKSVQERDLKKIAKK